MRHMDVKRVGRLILVIALLEILSFVFIRTTKIRLNTKRGIALYGYSFLNITNSTTTNCLESCLEQCRCLSFQMCKNTKCQLCSSTVELKTSSTRPTKDCIYVDFERYLPVNKKEQCGNSCSATINCCQTSNPCLNGGTCLSSFSTNSARRRYTCICPTGYAGIRCQEKILSCRGYKNGNHDPGRYKVLDDNSHLFDVFCDFDSKSNISWTLIQSYELQYSDNFYKSFFINYPIGEEQLSWAQYRVSKSRMQSIQRDTTKWRLTCNYNEQQQAYSNDFVISWNTMVDILNLNSRQCALVEHIYLRGFNCSNCTAFLGQFHDTAVFKEPPPLHFIANPYESCNFKPGDSEICNKMREQNFGRYRCINRLHDCSAHQNSTTQTWLGS